ncbi:MAG: DUF1232 domain-containing protein [Deltaproteobacteria bacterium]|nr:DUF1232 domain-containing protein [Deltaproteobacteria bacterium]
MGLFSNNRVSGTVSLIKFIWNLPQFIKLYWRLFCDGRVPFYLKILLVAALIYFLSPIDLIPELFNPLLGLSDDVAVLLLVFKYFIHKSPQDVVAEHVRRIETE